MKNLKIRVNSEAESKEVQDILFSAGKTHDDGSTDHYQFCFGKYPHFINCEAKYISASRTGYLSYDKITIPELRAMVNPMKEYLNENCNYEFVLSNKKYDGFIEIPEGAECAILGSENNIYFWKSNFFIGGIHENWVDMEKGYDANWYLNTKDGAELIWQRDQDEPFLTPECTLNDQYAEIEQVRQAINKSWGSVGAASGGAAQANGGVDATLSQRQSQYGCYEDVAHVTQEILKALRISGYDRMPATHKESMHMIASKMARLVCGDCNSIDGWHDISGYATLVERLIGDQSDV